MIRRKDTGINEMVLPGDEEMDLTRTPADQISNGDGLSVDTGEMDFLMEPKDNNTDLVARTRANDRVVYKNYQFLTPLQCHNPEAAPFQNLNSTKPISLLRLRNFEWRGGRQRWSVPMPKV